VLISNKGLKKALYLGLKLHFGGEIGIPSPLVDVFSVATPWLPTFKNKIFQSIKKTLFKGLCVNK